MPQDSILGPLLFLIYINDMCRCSTVIKFVYFADDTTVCWEGDDLTQMFEVMNAELKKVENWICANKLSLNLDKTAFMFYSNQNINIDDAIIIRDQTISRVRSTKFSWIIIDDELRFVDHIGPVCSKVASPLEYCANYQAYYHMMF